MAALMLYSILRAALMLYLIRFTALLCSTRPYELPLRPQLSSGARAAAATLASAASFEREGLGELAGSLHSVVDSMSMDVEMFLRRQAIKVETQVRLRGGQREGEGVCERLGWEGTERRACVGSRRMVYIFPFANFPFSELAGAHRRLARAAAYAVNKWQL